MHAVPHTAGAGCAGSATLHSAGGARESQNTRQRQSTSGLCGSGAPVVDKATLDERERKKSSFAVKEKQLCSKRRRR